MRKLLTALAVSLLPGFIKTIKRKINLKKGEIMRQLEIGTTKHTKVNAIDEPEFGASHRYNISETGSTVVICDIQFQKGPIKEHGINGIHNEDLIAIVLDRLQGFQGTDFKCRENAIAITKLEESMMWLRKRTNDRNDRGVEGTSKV